MGKPTTSTHKAQRAAAHYRYRTSWVPTKSALLKGLRDGAYDVLHDEYSRLYFIQKAAVLKYHWSHSREIPCYLVLASRYPRDDGDERGSLFPQTGERVALCRGKRQKNGGEEVMAFIYEPQEYPKRITGTAVLWLPEGLPS